MSQPMPEQTDFVVVTRAKYMTDMDAAFIAGGMAALKLLDDRPWYKRFRASKKLHSVIAESIPGEFNG